jgi:biotin carboxylase
MITSRPFSLVRRAGGVERLMKTILVLFPNDWDRAEFGRSKYEGKYRFVFYGDHLFKLPGALKLLSLNIHAVIDEIVLKYRNARIDGVLSTDEYIGVILAAVVAKRLRLPGPEPNRILVAQHKFYARKIQRRVVPSATPRFTLIPHHPKINLPLSFPIFVKPVKGTYSILARRVEDFDDLRSYLRIGLLERFLYKKVTRPFNDLLRSYTSCQTDANHFLGEEVIAGMQVTVDGYAYRGKIEILGIVDSVMYPRTGAFERFEYPSRLGSGVQERLAALARSFIRGMKFEYGLFNIEMFYNPETGDAKIIEINPRISYQFADLYEKVDGFNMYDLLISLALGESPSFRRGKGDYRNSASFVLRTFQGRRLQASPDRDHVQRLRRQFEDARLMLYGQRGCSFAREMRMVGSFRYAVINMGAASPQDLVHQFKSARDQLPFHFV